MPRKLYLLRSRALPAGARIHRAQFNIFRIFAEAGGFVLTGLAVTLGRGFGIAAGSGAFVLTGQDVGLEAAYRLAAGAGPFTLTGQDVTLTHDLGAADGLLLESGDNLLLEDGSRILLE